MESYVAESLGQGYIQPSASPVSSSFFFVKKKDGGLRPCIDYRGLNSITVGFSYPLPLIATAVESFHGARFFTKLDLRSAYNLVRIRGGDEWKTAFSTTSGHYEYRVMPYGLKNAPAVFQSFVDEILRDLLGQGVVVYIDDILIYSATLVAHVSLVRKVLGRLLEHDLYCKAEKCEFFKQSVSFLGYRISTSGVVMEVDRVTAVRNWPTPTTVKEVQRFLGFCQLLPEVYPGFWSGGCSHHLTAEGRTGALALVNRGGQSLQLFEGAVHQCARVGASGPLFSVHSGGGCVRGWGRGRAVPTLGRATQAPPVCFLFEQAQPSGAKL